MPTIRKTLTQLILGSRQEANVVFNEVVTDPEITSRLSEALSSLNDLLVAANEHYATQHVSFTLTNGSWGDQNNLFELPTDFYKEVGVDRIITGNNGRRYTVFPFTYSERNRVGRLAYTLLGSNLAVAPPEQAAGNYELQYVPLPPVLQIPATVVVNTDDTEPPFVVDQIQAGLTIPTFAAVDSIDGTTNSWHLTGATLTADDVGAKLVTSGFANAANNGTHTITAVSGPLDFNTDGITTTEVLAGTEVVRLTANPTQRGLWILKDATFTADHEGLDLIVSGTSWAGNSGTFVIDEVVNEYSVYTSAGYPLLNEDLSSSVDVQLQVPGTIYILPQIYTPWYEYLQAWAARKIKAKRQQDTSAQDEVIAALTARIQSMTTNRKEEGGQVPLTRSDTGGFWFDDPPWGVVG